METARGQWLKFIKCRITRCLVRVGTGSWYSKRYDTLKQKHKEVRPRIHSMHVESWFYTLNVHIMDWICVRAPRKGWCNRPPCTPGQLGLRGVPKKLFSAALQMSDNTYLHPLSAWLQHLQLYNEPWEVEHGASSGHSGAFCKVATWGLWTSTTCNTLGQQPAVKITQQLKRKWLLKVKQFKRKSFYNSVRRTLFLLWLVIWLDLQPI